MFIFVPDIAFNDEAAMMEWLENLAGDMIERLLEEKERDFARDTPTRWNNSFYLVPCLAAAILILPLSLKCGAFQPQHALVAIGRELVSIHLHIH